MARIAGSDDGPSGHSMMRKLACGLCPLAFAIVLPLAALAQGMPAAEPESLGLSTKRLERIAPALRRDIAAGLIPGAMMLVEEGRLSLADPISKYLPQFAHMQVGIEVKDPATGRASLRLVPSEREIRVEDLMRHTSGFTYEALGTGPKVKEMYRDAGIGPQDDSAAAMVEKLARLPLMYQPGTVWEYGRSIDVLGRILELLSGMPLSEFLAKRVFGPLRMPDTGFWVPPKKHNRIADVLPAPREGRRLLLNVSKPPKFESGGGGLVSTAADYARFLQMLLNGGEIDGVRLR